MVVALMGYLTYMLMTFEPVVPGYVILILVNLLIHYERVVKFCIKQYALRIRPQDGQAVWTVQPMDFTEG